MVGTEDIAALFFELSSSSRLDIILKLDEQALKLSQISKELDMSIQEASRHIARLCDAKLVDKCQDGQYSLTPYGRQIRRLFPSMRFISENSDFFSTHDFFVVPEQFHYGLGIIESYERSRHVMEAFRYTEELIKNAEKFIWIHSDQVLSSALPLIEDAVSRGVEFRLVLPSSIIEEDYGQNTNAEIPENYRALVQQRFPEKVEMIIVMSEKEALLAFPDLEGKMDYVGFSVEGPKAIQWCEEIFLYFWNKAA
ncbi:MAG: helix-turn-helix transcriptional regulator [Candidatus Thorarchaeota archaeon]